MKTIAQWQEKISKAALEKFPNNTNWTQYDRLRSIQEQLDDVESAIKVEDGLLESNDHGHQDPDHRIAALIADILLLAEKRNANVETELEKVLAWFKNQN